MRLVFRLIVVFVVVWLVEFAQGKIIHPKETWLHPSGHAFYVKNKLCTINADSSVSATEYDELLEWCKKIHREK